MDLRPLGAAGMLVSPIGLGTVKLGRNQAVKYPAPFDLPTDEQARELLRSAADLGVNLLDTAPAYGESESRLGRLLAGQRERWTIVTKAGESFEDGASSFDFSPAAITASLERSLRRLRTDRVDVALLHSDGRDEWVLGESGALDALRDCQRRGLVRAVGASTKTPEGGLLAADRCDVVMLTLNEAERADLPAVALARGRGVGVLIKKALRSGHAVAGAEDPAAALRRALALPLTTPGVSSVVVGTLSPERLRANVRAAEDALRNA